VLGAAGMERFDDILSERDVQNIHAYLIEQSWVAYRAQEAAKHP
jgi:mono/diheme cytochrome c family protein